jgi:hypothetical protein
VARIALHHVSFEVPPAEVERSVELWGLLGFEPVEAPAPLAPHVTWLEREAQQVHLIHAEGAGAPTIGHAAVVVAGPFAEVVERLRSAGFAVEDARELWGESRAFALAPGGHRIELMAAPPASGG